MKKTLFILVLIIVSSFTYGQPLLSKGMLLGLHYSQPVLNPGVSMDQYQDFVKTKMIPAYEKNFKGSKVYLLKGKRGDFADKYGMLIVFPSEAARDKYWNADGLTELGESAMKKMQPIQDEAGKLVKSDTDLFTDWIIQ
jgi:hypothetical protein